MTYFIGLDLGQLQDYTARAVLRVDDPPPAPAPPSVTFYPTDGSAPRRLPVSSWQDSRDHAEMPLEPCPQCQRRQTWGRDPGGPWVCAVCGQRHGEPWPPPKDPPPPPARLRCVGLHRWPLKTRYGAIVADMKAFLAGLPDGERWELVVDGTGVGNAVLEQLDAALIPYVAVSIHGGEATTREGNRWRVGKKTLVSALQVAAQNRLLSVEPPSMPYARELRQEMGNFRHTITAAANDTYASWRETSHDDLVLALSLAVWRATAPARHAWAA